MSRARIALAANVASPILQELDARLATHPRDEAALSLRCVMLQKDIAVPDVIVALKRAIASPSTCLSTQLRLARIAGKLGDGAVELEILRTASRHPRFHDEALRRLITLERRAGRLDAALDAAKRLISRDPTGEETSLCLVHCLIDTGRFADAASALENRLSSPSCSDQVIGTWADLMINKIKRPRNSLVRLARILSDDETRWIVHYWLGRALELLGHGSRAIGHLRRAAELEPNRSEIWYYLGVAQRHVGRAECATSFGRAFDLDVGNASALRLEGYDHTYRYGDASFARVNLAISRSQKYPKSSRVEVHYSAAKALEDVGEFNAAFEHYAEAGRLQKQITPWSDREMRERFQRVEDAVARGLLERIRDCSDPSNKPIFVFGMPRSGTSLVEQVLSCHPACTGLGEFDLASRLLNPLFEKPLSPASPGLGRRYAAAIEKTAGTLPLRIIDKTPENYQWVGLLDAILPNCYFIHCRRHPIDSCISQYKLFFGHHVPYSYDLVDLAKAYHIYDDYVKLWNNILPSSRILDVHYEDLVASFEGVARRIVDFVQLPWSDSCDRFFESERVIFTASSVQVRRPIYGVAVGRWRQFEKWLQPLLHDLHDSRLIYERKTPQSAKPQPTKAVST